MEVKLNIHCHCGGRAWQRQRVVWEYAPDLQEIRHWVECTNCRYFTIQYLNDPDKAIKEWNDFQSLVKS